MEDELFASLYHLIIRRAGSRGKRQQYADGMILLIYLWSVMCDRPVSWACDKRNRPALLKALDCPMPDPSTISRRLNSASVQQLDAALQAQLLAVCVRTMIACYVIDAKPMVVSAYSKDKQARSGFAYRGLARGYKLYAVCTLDRQIIGFHVDSMNVSEQAVAAQLVARIPTPGYLLADAIYDSDALHQQTALHQIQLIAPRRKPHTGITHNRPHPNRLHAIAMLETALLPHRFGRDLYACRTSIERWFAELTNGPVGLKPLPNWVRTLKRVRRWVHAKILIHAFRKSRT